MIQFVGSALIIVAFSACGMLFARTYRERPKQIRQWRSALQSIETEIVYGRVPVEELAGRLSGRLPEPVRRFFVLLVDKLRTGIPLDTAWEEAIREFWPTTSMRRAERDVILQFGATLGAEDTENQQKHIRLALADLEREEAEARAGQAANEKVFRNLGFLAGVLLVLLLL
ncbi:MAG: stage III sporulation protein AB [Sporolactobacillus sp.]|jgi:stage III sporulation protein AB|nr:stage III sporulation protein AB [Sporolactobacillus sp.]